MKRINLDGNLNAMVQSNAEWAWEQAQKELGQQAPGQEQQNNKQGNKSCYKESPPETALKSYLGSCREFTKGSGAGGKEAPSGETGGGLDV